MRKIDFLVVCSLSFAAPALADDYTVRTPHATYGCIDPRDLAAIKNLGETDKDAAADLLRSHIEESACEYFPSGIGAQIAEANGGQSDVSVVQLKIGERKLWFLLEEIAGGPKPDWAY